MAYFDYSPPPVVDPSKAAEAMGDALSEVMKRREQKRQFEVQMQQKMAHEDRLARQFEANSQLQNDIAGRKERRDVMDFEMRQGDQRQKTEKAARDAFTAGNPQEAERIMSGLVEFDPRTGQERGRGFFRQGPAKDVGPAPQAPQEPPAPQGLPPEIAARRRSLATPSTVAPSSKAFVGPIPLGMEGMASNESPMAMAEANAAREKYAQEFRLQQTADMVAEEEAARAQRQHQGDMAHYTAQKEIFPEQQKTYLAARAEAERSRPYTMGVGNEPGVRLDMASQRYGTREIAANDFLSSLPPNLTDQDKIAAQHAHAAIMAGEDPKAVISAFNKERVGISDREDKQQFTAGENEKYKRTFEQDKVLKSMTPPSVVLSERRFEASQNKDARKETREQIKRWLINNGLEKNGKQLADFDAAEKQLASSDGKSQMAGLVGMGRTIQGDNRWSNADHDVFVNKGGVGKLDQLDTTIQQLINGAYGDETIAVSRRLNAAMKAVLQERAKRAGEEGRRLFVHNELYDPMVSESYLDEALNGAYKRETPAIGPEGHKMVGGPPEVRAKKAAGSKSVKATGAPGSSLEDLLKRAEERLR